jgi:hypothetical protein
MRMLDHTPGKTYTYSPGWKSISCITCKREAQVHYSSRYGSLASGIGITGYATEIECVKESSVPLKRAQPYTQPVKEPDTALIAYFAVNDRTGAICVSNRHFGEMWRHLCDHVATHIAYKRIASYTVMYRDMYSVETVIAHVEMPERT